MTFRSTGTSALDIDSKMGARIRARRRQVGMGLKTLAFGLGVSYQQIQKYEHAKNKIYASKLVEVARLLDTSVAYLVGETENPLPAAGGGWIGTRDAGVCDVLEAVARLNSEQLAKVAKFVGELDGIKLTPPYPHI